MALMAVNVKKSLVSRPKAAKGTTKIYCVLVGRRMHSVKEMSDA